MTLHETYATMRAEHPTMPARVVLQWARHALEVDALYQLADIDGWAPMVVTVDGIRVEVHDDDGVYDWGDIDPDDDDRENLRVVGVVVGEESIWGCGYDERTVGSVARFAIGVALEHGFIDAMRERQEAAIVRSNN